MKEPGVRRVEGEREKRGKEMKGESRETDPMRKGDGG